MTTRIDTTTATTPGGARLGDAPRVPGSGPIRALRAWVRRRRRWVAFQEMRREGFRRAGRRIRYQRRILDTPPLRTGRAPDVGPGVAGGPTVEVRALTWRRDWINMIWALKSFYHFAGVDYPLYIHDGGLAPGQAERLMAHFPDATLVRPADADPAVRDELRRRGLARCLAFQEEHGLARKLIDYFVLSRADYVIMLDSDIVFFRRPDALIVPPEGVPRSRYNRDCGQWYCLEIDEIEARFGLRPPPQINAGLGLVRRASIDLEAIEGWLAHPALFSHSWIAEQTLHALCGALHGVEHLPDTYSVSVSPGLAPETVCKHYPGFFRYLLYEEGMDHLIASGFLDALRRR